MWVSPPLGWGGALSVANVIFIWFFFCVLSQDPARCAGHRAAPSCPGRTCTSAYARAEMRMRVPPPFVWGRALSVAIVFFVWFFFCVSSQYSVYCAVHSAAPSRPRGTRTCAYARRARARTEMRDVSGRDRDDAPRSSLRGQLGGTVIVRAVCPRHICVPSTPARLELGTCHCERYISSSGLRPDGTPGDATMQLATAPHGIHATNRTRISQPTLPISNDVVTSDTGAGVVGPPQDPHLAKAMVASGHHTGRGWASKPPPPPPITNDVVPRNVSFPYRSPPDSLRSCALVVHFAKGNVIRTPHRTRLGSLIPPTPHYERCCAAKRSDRGHRGSGSLRPSQGPLCTHGTRLYRTKTGHTVPSLASASWLRPPLQKTTPWVRFNNLLQ